MRIAILDSGCNLNNKSMINYSNYVDQFVFDKNCWKITCKKDTDCEFGHGTMVSRIILDNTDKANESNFKLYIFRIFDKGMTCDVNVLISALEYINENIDCDIVHMSLGVRSYSESLEIVCRKLYENGNIIVSAFDNTGAVSYPAAFDFVIGVSGSLRCQSPKDYVVLYNSIVDFKAKNGKQKLFTTPSGDKLIDGGNSLAAPYITAQINNLNPMTNNIDLIKQKLEEKSRYIYKYPNKPSKLPYHIKKASVFPYNKETQNILNFVDELEFELVDFYDIKYTGNLNKKCTSLFSDYSFIIKDYEKIDWSSFDTLIIGHLEELSILCNRPLKKEILEKCLMQNKNVFSFDDLYLDEFRKIFLEKGLSLICPCDCITPNPKLGMLYQFATPILTVFGTSKKQGKFTLQLEIRKLLQNKGVMVGQIGTEPNSILFGMNQSIPFGYYGIDYPNSKMIELINNEVHEVEKTGCDIIILGSQSGFIPERVYNTHQIMMNQFCLMFAAPTDGVILAVNIQDSFSFIIHTIRSIEAVGNTHVFLLALYAFDVTYDYIISSNKKYLSQKQIENFKKQAKEKVGLDVIVTGDENDSNKLFDSIITYFCADR